MPVKLTVEIPDDIDRLNAEAAAAGKNVQQYLSDLLVGKMGSITHVNVLGVVPEINPDPDQKEGK